MGWRCYEVLGNRYLVAPLGEAPDGRTISALCTRWEMDGVLLGRRDCLGKIHLRIFNADGSEAEMSGNGVCIFCRALRDGGEVAEPAITLHLGTRCVRCRLEGETVAADLGTYALDGEKIELPAASGYRVDVANPHFVIAAEKIPPNWRQLAAELARHPHFPGGVNVEFMRLAIAHLELRIHERGVGETASCGSGAAAAAALAHEVFGWGKEIAVRMPGGTLHVRLHQGHAHIRGPVRGVVLR
jgi:diaminopimelate epimerase